MAILNNTNAIFPVGQPGSFLRARGLAGMGDVFDWSADDIQKLVTGINAQQLFQINLDRGQQGLPPLNPQQYAPQVALGLNPQTQTLAMLGIAAVLAAVLFSKKRK